MHRQNNKHAHWLCSKANTLHCRASVRIDKIKPEIAILKNKEHNHGIDAYYQRPAKKKKSKTETQKTYDSGPPSTVPNAQTQIANRSNLPEQVSAINIKEEIIDETDQC